MRILPIASNNTQKNVSHKGTVSDNVIKKINAYPKLYENLLKFAKTRPEKYPTLISGWESTYNFTSKYAEAIISNLKTIMSRFGKSCVLELHQSEKNHSKHLFVIESKDSIYKHICGEVEINADFEDTLVNLNRFSTDNLAKINPYETNLNFMQMWQPQDFKDADIFEAEKDIWFIEDELVVAEPTVKSNGKELTIGEISEHYKKLSDERKEFVKEFPIYMKEKYRI